eukprot:366193-Prorocentrum_minimum.AAC.1
MLSRVTAPRCRCAPCATLPTRTRRGWRVPRRAASACSRSRSSPSTSPRRRTGTSKLGFSSRLLPNAPVSLSQRSELDSTQEIPQLRGPLRLGSALEHPTLTLNGR